MKPNLKNEMESSQASPAKSKPKKLSPQPSQSKSAEPKHKSNKRSIDETTDSPSSTKTAEKKNKMNGTNGVVEKASLPEVNGEKRRKVSEESSKMVNGNGAKKTSLIESESSASPKSKPSAISPSVKAMPRSKSAPSFSTAQSIPKSKFQNNKFNNANSSLKRSQTDPHMSGRPGPKFLEAKKLKLLEERKKLPIWIHRADIRFGLRLRGDVLLLVGETGSGKSTQVPQFLLNEPWLQRKLVMVKEDDGEEKEASVGGMIAVTEPRRVAAVSLAQRVAAETGSHLGANMNTEDKVGYAVRFETSVPRNAKIKFMTEGMLLQELLGDKNLRKYSCIIVDEVHERSVDVDLLLGFLKIINSGDLSGRGGIPLKIIIMSATADIAKLKGFFTPPQHPSTPIEPKISPKVNGHIKDKAPNVNGVVKKWISGTSHPDDAGLDTGRASSEPLRDRDGELAADEAVEDQEADEEHPVNGSRRSSTASNDSIRSTYSSWSGLSDTIKEGDLATTSTSEILTEELPQYTSTVTTQEDFECDKADSAVPGDKLHDLKGTNNTMVHYISGRQHPVSMLYIPEPVTDVLEGCFRTIFIIHSTEPMPGDILVFLTGQEEISALQARVEAQAVHLLKQFPRLEVVPLFGQMSIEKQQVAFARPKNKNARKVILATNIAETSITVPGVRYVVDTGKAKVKEYRPHLGLASLLPKPISKSSATQRKGRAGREAPGKVWRLYTEQQFFDLPDADRPEILRNDIVEAVLKMKARGIDDIFSFPLMDAPPRDTMVKALNHLFNIGALAGDGTLNDVGKQMASFPLSPNYARVLVAAAQPDSDCLLEAIDAIAVLSGDDIFTQPQNEEERETSEEARKDLLRREGDILTQLTAMQRYCAEAGQRKKWCEKHLINERHMDTAFSVRRQLRQACIQAKLVAKTDVSEADEKEFVPLAPERAEALLKCFLTAFVGKTAMLDKDGMYKTTIGRHTVMVHPSSVMHGKKKEAIMYLEHVFTNKNYAKKCSGVQMDWIAEVMGGTGGI
jgi:ATP-dependent RNA helicase DHR2